MSTISTPGSGLARPSAENDIYTVLIVVAFLFVLTATIYVGYRAQTLFDTLLPPGGS
jgi:hypothetical protein